MAREESQRTNGSKLSQSRPRFTHHCSHPQAIGQSKSHDCTQREGSGMMSWRRCGDSMTAVFTSASLGQRAFHIQSTLTPQSTQFWPALREKCVLTFFFPKTPLWLLPAKGQRKSIKQGDFPDDAVGKRAPTRVPRLSPSGETPPTTERLSPCTITIEACAVETKHHSY